MELPHIGQVCVICRRNDYLPFKCSYCDKIICIDHRSDHGTECPLQSQTFHASASDCPVYESIKQACDFCHKITLKLELNKCPECENQHCLYHRLQAQHDCVKLAERRDTIKKETDERLKRQRAALENIKRITKSNSDHRVSSASVASQLQRAVNVSLDPNKRELAKRVRIMKIKQSARGPPNILQEDKIYFEVEFLHEPKSSISDVKNNGKTIKIFTTPKHSVGRMIDWSADELGVMNKNNLPEADQLVFRKQREGVTTTGDDSNKEDGGGQWIHLDSQKCFSFYLDNGALDNGDKIVMMYLL